MIAVVLFACAASMPAQAQQTDWVRDRAMAEVRAAVPGARVTTMQDDRIVVNNAHAFVLDIRPQCATDDEGCRAALHDFGRRVAAVVQDAGQAVSRERMIGVVRSQAYLERVREMSREPGPRPLVSANLAGVLMLSCYFDLPSARRPVFTRELAQLDLSEAAALELCRTRTHAALPPLAARWRDLPERGFGALQETQQEASYMLFPHDWAPLAARLGALIVAAPSEDLVIYGRCTDAIAVDAMMTLAREATARARVPISDRVYLWTLDGWRELSAGASC
jgi:hypothetical protein